MVEGGDEFKIMLVTPVQCFSHLWLQQSVSDVQQKLKTEKENISQQNKEIKKITHRKDELQNDMSNLKLKILKAEGEQKKLKEEYENAEKTVRFW